MKKYTTLPTDCTTLAAEVMAYLTNLYDLEDTEHHVTAWHSIDPADLSSTSLNSTFSGLTAIGIGHVTVNGDAMFNHCYGKSFMIIPLSDCESTTVKIFDVASGATLQTDAGAYYLDSDCTLTDTIPLTGPVLIGANTTFTVQSDNLLELGDILMVWFNEDVSSYLA